MVYRASVAEINAHPIGCAEGFTVSMDFDPLLAKLAVWAGSREEAIARMSRALDEFHISGIHTGLNFFRRLFQDRVFQEGNLHTGFIDAFLARDR